MTDVCVVGLGKIGLPLACAVARVGHRVRGADISQVVVDQVNAAIEPFPGEAGLAEALAETVESGSLSATTDTIEAVANSDVVLVVVPLVVDDAAKPDFQAMDAATEAIGRGLRPGTLVSYETTLPVETTRKRFTQALAETSGLTPGVDLFVVHSPERVFSGRVFEDLRRYPKLVGGVDATSTGRGIEFYRSFLEFDDRVDLTQPNGVWDLGTCEAAEMAKLAETTYRDLNIAYANELAIAAEAMGIDVYKVIDACNSQPFSHIHQPGISVGGHCIPVYPHFLLGSVPGMSLPRTARSVNSDMPSRAVSTLERALGGLDGRRVVVLGVSYRNGVKEHAFSGVFALAHELIERGAIPTVIDPLYSAEELRTLGLDPHREGDHVDGAILHTAHQEFTRLRPPDLPGVRVIVDGRAALDAADWTSVNLATIGR